MPKNPKKHQINPQATEKILQQTEEDETPNEKTVVATRQTAVYSGPLPPPGFFQQYEDTLPGSADRILKMSETEQLKRIDWEEIDQQSKINLEKRGQWMGFTVAILCVLGAIFLAQNGHQWPAIIMIGASAVSLVGRFTGWKNTEQPK